jgi:hypothetical protein
VFEPVAGKEGEDRAASQLTILQGQLRRINKLIALALFCFPTTVAEAEALTSEYLTSQSKNLKVKPNLSAFELFRRNTDARNRGLC